jgi:DNA-binding NarL/FixJ family response regulator
MNDRQKLLVLIVDDEMQFRQGLCTLLGFYNTNRFGSLSNGLPSILSHSMPEETSGSRTAIPEIEVVGEASNVDRALKLVNSQHPDLILLDMELAGSDGITALIALKEMSYSGKILVLSGHQEDSWIFRAMQAGASGYVFKSRLATQLWEAINTVMQSEIYLPIEAASKFFHRFQAEADLSRRTCEQLHLTDREQEVLQWLTHGDSNEEIAKHLYVTIATVKAHLTSIFNKLNVTSRAQAIVAAVKLGLVYT